MKPADPRHVVRPQRRGDDVQQQPRGRVKHRQQVHDRETAAGLLAARLTELLLQLRGVGHRHTGAIDQKGPVAMPAAVVERRTAEELFAERTQQALKYGQRQTLACLAIGLAAAVHRSQAWRMGASGVAVQDLQREQLKGRDRIEHALAPDMADAVTDLADELGSEKPGEFTLDLRDGGKDTAGHPWPPVGVMR